MTSGADSRGQPGRPVTVPARPTPPATVPAGPASPAGAPERPTLEGEAFAATVDPGERPASVTVSVMLWLTGALVALFGVGVLWRGQDGIRARFAATALEQDPDRAAEVITDAGRYAFLAGAGSVALVAVLHLALALLMYTGRVWARNLLVVTAVLGIAVAVLVQDLVADPARDLLDDVGRLTLLAQATFVVAATVVMLLPSAGRWLRRARMLS